MPAAAACACPPLAPRLGPMEAPMDVPDFPLLEDAFMGDVEQDAVCPPAAPRLRPSAPPMDLSPMSSFELPPAAEDDDMGLAEFSLDSTPASPKALSELSTSAASTSYEEYSVSPPRAPRLRPAAAPQGLPVPEFELPPSAEDSDSEGMECEEMIFVLDGLSDDGAESDHGVLNPSIFEPSISERKGLSQPNISHEAKKVESMGDALFSHLLNAMPPHMLLRASSACSTRASTPRPGQDKELSPSSVGSPYSLRSLRRGSLAAQA